jgi:hypothetical protein
MLLAFFTGADFPSDSGGPAASDIHDNLIVTAAADIPNVNDVLAVVSLPASYCWFHYTCKPP